MSRRGIISLTRANEITDYFAEVAKGNLTGQSGFTIFMNNPSVGTTLEDLWGVGGIRTTITAAETIELVSDSAADTSAGTGAKAVLILSLDADFKDQSNVVVMNGTTPVIMPDTIINIQRMIVLSVGSSKVNVGNITAQVSAAGDPRGIIRVGNGLSHDCFYTIPVGFNAIGITLFPTWPKDQSGVIRSLVKNNGSDQAELTTVEFAVYQSGIIVHPKMAGIRPEKSEIFYRASSANDDQEVNAIAEFLVYSNDPAIADSVEQKLELMVQGA